MVRRMARRPGWPCAVLLVTGVIALMLGGLALYARHAVLDARAFADRATGDAAPGRGPRRDRRRGSPTREIEPTPGAGRRAGPCSRPRSPTSSTSPRFRGEFHAGAHGAAPRAVRRRLASRDARWRCPAPARELRAAVAARSPAAARDAPARRTRSSSRSAAAGSRARCVDAAPRRARLSALRRSALLAGLVLLVAAALARADAAARAAPRGARARARGRRDRRGDLDRPRRGALDLRHVRTATRSWARSGARSWPTCGCGALVAGAVGRDRRGGLRAGRAAARGGGCSTARHGARAAAPRGWRAPAALVLLAVLLLWMPEVPLDLALVAAAGLLVFSGAGRGRPLGPAVINPIDRLQRPRAAVDHPGMDSPDVSSASPWPTSARSPGASSAGCSSSARSSRRCCRCCRAPTGKVLTPTLPIGDRGVRLGRRRAARQVDWRDAPGWVIHVSTVLGALSIAVATHDTGGADSPARLLMMLVLVFAAYFFPAREAWPYLALVLALHELPLAYDDDRAQHRAARRAADRRPLLLAAGLPADHRQARDDRRCGRAPTSSRARTR